MKTASDTATDELIASVTATDTETPQTDYAALAAAVIGQEFALLQKEPELFREMVDTLNDTDKDELRARIETQRQDFTQRTLAEMRRLERAEIIGPGDGRMHEPTDEERLAAMDPFSAALLALPVESRHG